MVASSSTQYYGNPNVKWPSLTYEVSLKRSSFFYTTVTRPLHDRYTTVTGQSEAFLFLLHDRYATVTQPLQVSLKRSSFFYLNFTLLPSILF